MITLACHASHSFGEAQTQRLPRTIQTNTLNPTQNRISLRQQLTHVLQVKPLFGCHPVNSTAAAVRVKPGLSFPRLRKKRSPSPSWQPFSGLFSRGQRRRCKAAGDQRPYYLPLSRSPPEGMPCCYPSPTLHADVLPGILPARFNIVSFTTANPRLRPI